MKKLALLLDSSFGIKENQYPDVYIVPMEIIETDNGKVTSYLDQVDIFNEQICEKISKGCDIKTSQPILGNVIKTLDKLTKEYENVYALTIPSTISGTFQNWKVLENDYKNLKVYDQTMVGCLSEWTIIDFLNASKENKLDDAFIKNYLKQLEDKRAGLLIVPDVSQLKKGGRVSNFKSLLIKLLGLKLIISLSKEGLIFRDKAKDPQEAINRGNKALNKLIPLEQSKIRRFVVFTNSKADRKFDITQYIKIIETMYPKVKIEHTELPSVITAHVGPNYFVFGMDLE
ncbi:MAG: DegV family EDD domain-containing protein [Mycoplasmataceae bacterium]|nr:DegV family EDD domain-containing protein [Mycoplasmataceae bacterium]